MPWTILCPTKPKEENRILGPWCGTRAEVNCRRWSEKRQRLMFPALMVLFTVRSRIYGFSSCRHCWVAVATFGGGASTGLSWRRGRRGLCDRPKKLGCRFQSLHRHFSIDFDSSAMVLLRQSWGGDWDSAKGT